VAETMAMNLSSPLTFESTIPCNLSLRYWHVG
jgi:hypothetical protein